MGRGHNGEKVEELMRGIVHQQLGFAFACLFGFLSLSIYMTVNMYVYVCRERKVRVCERERSDFLRLVALSISLSVL